MLCCTTAAYAQKQKNNKRGTTKIEESVLSPSEDVPTYIHFTDQVIFKLHDVNTFLYDVNFKEIQRDNISKEVVPKDDFQILYNASDYSLAEISYTDFNLPATSSAGPASDRSFNGELKKAKDELFSKTENLNELLQKRDQLINDTVGIDKNLIVEISSKMNDLTTKIDAAKQQVKRAKKAVGDAEYELNEHLTTSNDNNVHVEAFGYSIDRYLQVVTSINTKVNFYNELLFLMYSSQPFEEIKRTKENLLHTYLGADVGQEEIMGRCNMLFNDLDAVYIDLIDKYSAMPDRSKIESSYQKLVKYHNGIDRKKYRELFNQIVKTYLAINETNSTVDYQTSMISDKADKIAYHISLTPRSSQYATSNKAIQLNYDFDIKGGVKIDVSAGIFYHFNLNDDQYRFEPLTDSTSLLVKENDDKQFKPSIGALFNVYRRSNKSVKFAFNFGAGTNVDKIFYYTGGSVLFGKSERVGISAGVVGGTVARISNELKNKTIVKSPIEDLNEVPMQRRDPFQLGYFVGVSYNLSGKNQSSGRAMQNN